LLQQSLFIYLFFLKKIYIGLKEIHNLVY